MNAGKLVPKRHLPLDGLFLNGKTANAPRYISVTGRGFRTIVLTLGRLLFCICGGFGSIPHSRPCSGLTLPGYRKGLDFTDRGACGIKMSVTPNQAGWNRICSDSGWLHQLDDYVP